MALIAAAALLLGGCAALPERAAEPLARHLAAPGPRGACARFLAALDAAVARAGVADAGAARVPGFPYLRVDRFLAGEAPHPQGARFDAWVDAMRALDRGGRRVEMANLPRAARARAASAAPPGARTLAGATDTCADVLRVADLGDPRLRDRLVRVAAVPSAYRTGQRLLGLYPVTSLPFLAGVARLHAELRADLERPLESLPVRGTLIRYVPPAAPRATPAEVARILARASANPLGVPRPRGADRERLFAAFAPVWEVDVASHADRIGTPAWRAGPAPVIDVERPVAYRKLSHARFGGRVLLQLSYVIWFPSRPLEHPLDLLGGHVDGITWRVTLGTDGRALAYDAMHNCGCYHMMFPTAAVRARGARGVHEEPVLVLPPVDERERGVVVRIERSTHYLQHVYAPAGTPDGIRYRLDDYARLRSLPLPGGGRRSLFRPDGLVPGTARKEEVLFWPMGVSAPGAMRQWGHHAIAFVGERYFDEPGLLRRHLEAAGE